MQHLATRFLACHFNKRHRPIQANGFVSHGGKLNQVAAGATTKIEDLIRWLRPNVSQESLDVLRNIVVACAKFKGLGIDSVMADGSIRNIF